jgi:hypothetical protein
MKFFAIFVFSGGLAACAGTSSDGGGGGGIIPDLTGGVRPPPAQGASVFTVQSASPAPAGKTCPVVTSTGAIPEVAGIGALDADTYQEKIVDGDHAAQVRCKVAVGADGSSFEGLLQLGARSFSIQNGVLGADRKGTADVNLRDDTALSVTFSSGGPCTIDGAAGVSNNFQVKAGSMWASFSCPSVEAAPSDYCRASGFFVLENCER